MKFNDTEIKQLKNSIEKDDLTLKGNNQL